MTLVLILASCTASEPVDQQTWGNEAVVYFDALADAYTSNDFYGVLDFYTPDAFVSIWRGDLRGGATVRNLMRWNSGDLDQRIHSLHIGSVGAITLLQWLAIDEKSAVVRDLDGDWISAETVFDLVSSVERSLRSSPDVLDTYRTLYEGYSHTWTDGELQGFADLYADDAQLEDPLLSVQVVGLDAITAERQDNRRVDMVKLSGVGGDPSDESAAIYIGPAEYGVDPNRAVGVFVVTEEDGCERQMAVLWQLEDGLVTSESRYQEIESFRKCHPGELPEGWWSGLTLPPPRDQVKTGVIRSSFGSEIEVFNGTRPLEEMVLSGIARFAEAGIGEPLFDIVTFEPSRSCTNRSGRLIQKDGIRQLYLCFYETDICAGIGPCEEPSLSTRISVLHELAHAWLLDHVGADAQSRLLQLQDLETWDEEDVAWRERGVEYSAEVIVWGLLHESISMARIGRPPCQELGAAFELLTGVEASLRADECQMS